MEWLGLFCLVLRRIECQAVVHFLEKRALVVDDDDDD